MTFEEAKKKLEDWYEDNCVEISPELLDCCYRALQVVTKPNIASWKLNRDGSGTCNKCHFTQKNVWDYDNWQRYCGVCGAEMIDAN